MTVKEAHAYLRRVLGDKEGDVIFDPVAWQYEFDCGERSQRLKLNKRSRRELEISQ